MKAQEGSFGYLGFGEENAWEKLREWGNGERARARARARERDDDEYKFQ